MTERPNTKLDNTSLPFGQRTALGIRENFTQELLEIATFREEWTAVIKPDAVLPVMTFLRDHWNYKMCHDVTSVDLFPAEPRFMVVYHLLNLDRSTRFRVKAPLPGDKAVIDSVVKLWPGANFMEREVFDLMGITFKGHPDLRRVLMAADYEGHPLRKDFPLLGFDVGVDSIKE